MADFKFESMETSASGLDAFFEREPQVISPGPVPQTKKASVRRKVGSISDLNGFIRASSDTLVHKSTNDLWALRQEGEGYFIERLFNDDGAPLKG